MNVAFTKFIAPEGQSMCKRAYIDETEPSGFRKEADKFFEGQFETVVCDWDDFGSVLAGLKLNECLCYGTSRMRDGRGWKKSGECGGGGKVRRTLDNFGWNALAHGADAHILFLDIDQVPNGDDDAESVLEQVLKDVPELDKVRNGFWAYPSSGAYLSGGGRSTGLSGLHFYAALPASIDPMAFRTYLYNYLVCTGKGSIKENSDARLRVVTYIDHTAIGAERIDYIAGASCGAGVCQDRWAPRFFGTEGRDNFVLRENGVWNKSKSAGVKDALKRQYRIAEGSGYEARLDASSARLAEQRYCSVAGVKKSYEMLDHGELLGSELLVFDAGGLNVDCGGVGTYAWRAALLREKYHEATLADPRDAKLRPNKAKFFANSAGQYGGRPAIHGFKGDNMVFKVVFDLESVQMATASQTPESMAEAYGSDWWWIVSEYAGVDASEEVEVMTMLKNRWSKNEKDLRKKISGAIKSVAGKVVRDKLGEAVEEYNRKYACVRLGSDVRVLWDEESSVFGHSVTCEMTKFGFFDLKAPDKVWGLDGKGNEKALSVPKTWFENEDRATYMGTTFDPNTLDRSVNNMFNMWRGWCVEREQISDRKCHGQQCGGKGCLSWFLSVGLDLIDLEGDPTLNDAEWRSWGCGASVEAGILWWLRSAFENLTEGNREHFEWLMGWVANLFQDPARKPGTCILLRGNQGVGKGQFVKPLEEICKRHFYQATKRRETTGQFNAHLENLLLLFVDESTWGGDRSAAQEWKALISEETYGIEKKKQDIIIGKNHARVIVASNEDQPLSIERTDRRHFVLECLDRLRERDDTGTSRGLTTYWKNVAACNRGVLLDEMLSFQYKTDPKTAPVSDGLRSQKMLGASEVEKLLVMALEGHPEVFKGSGVTRNYLYWLLTDVGRFAERKHYAQTRMTAALTRLFARMPAGAAEPRTPFRMKVTAPETPDSISNVKGRGWFLNGVVISEWVEAVFGYEVDFEPEL